MLTVHHLGVSQSERIVWLCEELGIAYDLKVYDRRADNRLAPDDYKALHPLGTAPIITDGDVVLPESAAIVEYIIHTYGGGRLAVPPGAPNYADYLFWFHFINGGFMPSQFTVMISRALGVTEDDPRAAWVGGRGEAAWALIEKRLGEVPYLAGPELTAADIMIGFSLTTMRAFVPRDISGSPNILAYLQRIAARPAYQRAMAKGDPGMALMLT
ncbi:glutathione S-transferase family protein [uncultured Phenylobacterium sp.]|uniref:glutathione S-transferase family protein n=1 Tax=uncultured Phenylobacterium sp. TaxID=349273 RepID=UPI0025F948E2|nr:glutathione S-transferase family protein [uncultured Phenylobacterium sp.]